MTPWITQGEWESTVHRTVHDIHFYSTNGSQPLTALLCVRWCSTIQRISDRDERWHSLTELDRTWKRVGNPGVVVHIRRYYCTLPVRGFRKVRTAELKKKKYSGITWAAQSLKFFFFFENKVLTTLGSWESAFEFPTGGGTHFRRGRYDPTPVAWNWIHFVAPIKEHYCTRTGAKWISGSHEIQNVSRRKKKSHSSVSSKRREKKHGVYFILFAEAWPRIRRRAAWPARPPAGPPRPGWGSGSWPRSAGCAQGWWRRWQRRCLEEVEIDKHACECFGNPGQNYANQELPRIKFTIILLQRNALKSRSMNNINILFSPPADKKVLPRNGVRQAEWKKKSYPDQ